MFKRKKRKKKWSLFSTGSNPGKIHRSGAPSVELWELCQMLNTAAHPVFWGSFISRPFLTPLPSLWSSWERKKWNRKVPKMQGLGVGPLSCNLPGLCQEGTQLRWVVAGLDHEVLSEVEMGEGFCLGNTWVTRQGAKKKDVERLESKPEVLGWTAELQRLLENVSYPVLRQLPPGKIKWSSYSRGSCYGLLCNTSCVFQKKFFFFSWCDLQHKELWKIPGL